MVFSLYRMPCRDQFTTRKNKAMKLNMTVARKATILLWLELLLWSFTNYLCFLYVFWNHGWIATTVVLLHFLSSVADQPQTRLTASQSVPCYAVPSEQRGLLLLQSCYGDLWLPVSTPVGQGYIDLVFSLFCVKIRLSAAPKGWPELNL